MWRHPIAPGVQHPRPRKVVIARGGLAGLCCGYELMVRGHERTVLEAARRIGAHVKTMYSPMTHGLYAAVGASTPQIEAESGGQDSLRAFRKLYPGKSENFYRTAIQDWSTDLWAHTCERVYRRR